MNFRAAYDAVLAKWPVPVEPVGVPSAFGTTHLNVCGPAGGTPLVLLHSGDAGRSVADGRPIRSREDLTAWLDALLGGLGLDTVRLCGHSYGAWLALSYALHAPHRVGRLAPLDPTTCFAGLNLTYRLRAVPLFVRPSADRVRAFMRWETGGAPIDPAWLEVTALTADAGGGRAQCSAGSPLSVASIWPAPPRRGSPAAPACPTALTPPK